MYYMLVRLSVCLNHIKGTIIIIIIIVCETIHNVLCRVVQLHVKFSSLKGYNISFALLFVYTTIYSLLGCEEAKLRRVFQKSL